jgi:acetolactate synthase-1/2/3 large subunit
MTTTLIHCAAATTNTTNSTKMMTGSKGLLASKDSRTRIKVVKVASYYGGRKGAFRCNAKNPSDGGKGGKNGAGEKKLRGAKALQNKAVSEPPSSQGRQSDLTPAFISPSQFTEMQLSTSQMKNLASQRPTDQTFVSQFAADEPRKGADILVEALEREGVDCVFAYPGGASMEIHQALTRSTTGIRNVLCRHEQGEVFAAEGYGKATGKIGVCIATSGPGATNLVTGLADALLDSVPMVAITGQVPRAMIGTDAFQETPIVEITRQITKHNYLVMNVEEIPRIIREAFFLAASGRPGPVLVDIPKDVQQQMSVPYWSPKVSLNGYLSRLPIPPSSPQIDQVMEMIKNAKKPVIYSGGGCLDASDELTQFAKQAGIPICSTLMGLGAFPESDDLSLRMLGMHGAVYANYAIDNADLMLAFGVRFDDRVTGKLDAFASRASIVHVDIDPAEIGKNKKPHCSIFSNIKPALRLLNEKMSRETNLPDFSAWRNECNEQKKLHPFPMPNLQNDEISPQAAIQLLYEVTNGEAVISTGVGQHQMWAAQHYLFDEPRNWLSSGGLGSMGFGLPAAIGAAAARPDKVVVDIDGDGSVRHEHSRVGDVARRAVAGQMLHFEQPIFRHGRTMGGPIL